jgi:predicted ATPase
MPEEAFAMLTDVTIEGLRGVGRVELSFAPEQRVYVLFGANGVGKTKCLEALWQFMLASSKEFAQDSWVQHGQAIVASRNSIVMTRMSAEGVTFEMPEKSTDVKDLFPLSHIWGQKSTVWHSYPVVFLGAARRASLNIENRVPVGPLGKFADRRREYFQVLQQVLMQNGDSRSLGMSGTSEWFVKRVRVASDRYKSKDSHEAEINVVLSTLHAVDPRIDHEYLQIDDDDRVFLKVDGVERALDELSSGFAALLKMVQAIVAGYAAFTNEKQLQRVRGIVFIDEIDAHLHAEWQVRIIPCLKALFPNTTFYIATHSPLVLKQLKEKEAYLLKRDDDGVVRSRMIRHPNRRLFVDVLEDGLGVNLNALDNDDDQSDLKQRMLSLLQAQEKGAA